MNMFTVNPAIRIYIMKKNQDEHATIQMLFIQNGHQIVKISHRKVLFKKF